jgi:hypothetical protein
MKTLVTFIGLATVLTASSSAFAAGVGITDSSVTSFQAADYTTTQLALYGYGFFPGYRAQDLKNDLRVEYRQVSPTFSEWKTAPLGNTGPVSVTTVSPQEIMLSTTGITGKANAGTVWSFVVCARTVGCSGSLDVSVRGEPGELTLNSSATAFDVGAGSTLHLSVTGSTTYAPVLMTAGNKPYQGEFTSVNGTAWFNLPIGPGVYNAYVLDPLTGADTSSFLVRVFNAPSVTSGSAKIDESLRPGEAIQNASLALKFAQMTFPTIVEWIDGASTQQLNVPVDLLTNQTTISIPASWLRTGSYTATLLLANAGGVTRLPVAVSIGEETFVPHPHPIVPIPVPGRN